MNVTRRRRDTLILAHQDWVLRLATGIKRRLPSDGHDLEDIAQDGMVGLVAAASRYDRKRNSSFEGWAYRRVYGSIMDSLRRQRWFEATQIQSVATRNGNSNGDSEYHGVDEEPAAPDDSEADVQAGECRRLLRRARALELDCQEQAVIAMYYDQDRPDREIAAALGMRAVQVSQIRRQALERLRGRCLAMGLRA